MRRSATVQFKIRHHGEYLLTPDGLRFLCPPADSPLAEQPVDQEMADVVFEDIDNHHVTPEEVVPDRIAKEFEVPVEWVHDIVVTPLPALPALPEGAVD